MDMFVTLASTVCATITFLHTDNDIDLKISNFLLVSLWLAMEGSKSSSTTMQVSFVCQRCCQPLKLDTSFNVLDRVTIQELIGMYNCKTLSHMLYLLCV